MGDPPRRIFTPSPAPSEPYGLDEATKSRMNGTLNNIKAMDSSNITLWQFLLELLVGNQHREIIQWTNNEGEFKLINAEEVAKLWGLRKNKNNMTYDKLSRALRYYYDKNIIKKVMGQKFMYKFVSFPEIVKTETKVPFKVKMESLAQEYGQQVLPHFASYNAASIKSSAQQATANNWIKKEETEQDNAVTVVIKNSEAIISNSNSMNFISASNSSSSISSMSNSGDSATALNLSRNKSPVSTSSSKPKPNPLSLNVTPAVQTTLSVASPVPILSPKLISAQFPTLNTPAFMFASPMIGPRTPLPLHFWSSLSPITTMSPRLTGGTSSTAFQFPNFVGSQAAVAQMSLPNFSAIESLNSPVVSSPTRTIPVL